MDDEGGMDMVRKSLAILLLLTLTACGNTTMTTKGTPSVDRNEDYNTQLKLAMQPSGPRILAADEIRLSLDDAPITLTPAPLMQNGAAYVPLRAISTFLNAAVWYNATSNTIGINQGEKRIAFMAGSTSAMINGVRTTIPPSITVTGTTYVPIRFIATAFGYEVGWVDATSTVTIHTKPVTQPGVTVSYKTHTVVSGDTMWSISVKYGIPMLELLKLNNLSLSSPLSLGQTLNIPVYTVPVRPAVGPQYGELLDWWTEARYVFPIGSIATVTDFVTGRKYQVKYTMGGNHADSEPLTAADAQIMKDIWGGTYSWTPRAVLVQINGRKLAAASHSYPHDGESILDNNYPGHFCIHFLNSTRHVDGLVQASMQAKIKMAAGVQ
jgi:LysM repeat protein